MHSQIKMCTVAFIFSLAQANPIVIYLPESNDNNCLDKKSAKTNSNTEETLNKEVFKMPRNMKVGDVINITGLMKDNHEVLTVNLVASNGEGKPDHLNVACQVKLDFPTETNTKDMITINTIANGVRKEVDERVQATELFLDNLFNIKFTVISENKIALNLKESSTRQDCETEYGLEAIQYLTVGGDVHKVEELNFVLG